MPEVVDKLAEVRYPNLVLFNPHALTAVRELRGLSKSELADRAKKSRPYITQLEGADRKSPSRAALRDIAEVLQIEDDRVFYVEPTIDELLKELSAARDREAASR